MMQLNLKIQNNLFKQINKYIKQFKKRNRKTDK